MSTAQNHSEHLLPSHREEGKKLVRTFVAFNGISVAFLMNDLLILYGIRNGLTDPQLAVLASFIHLTMPFMIFGKKMIQKIGAAKTWGNGWFFRYLSATVLIFAPFIGNVAPQWAVTATILFSGFGFAFFRAIGLVGNSPIMGEITTPRDRGSYIAGNWIRSQSVYLLSMVTVVLLMRFFDEVWIYQVVIGVGCGVGLYASRQLVNVPETSVPKTSASVPLREAFLTLWNKNRYRRILFAWVAAFCSFVLVIPFSIITIKNGYGLSDSAALIFTLLIISGGIFSSVINRTISDRVGPRPLLIIFVSGFCIVSGYWFVSPPTFYTIPVGLAFFIAGFCKTGIIISTNHYFLSAVDDRDRVGTSMFIRMISGGAAGFAGSVGGGTILKVLGTLDISGLDLYRTYFRIIFLVLIPSIIIIIRLEPLKEWKVRNILGLLFSPRDLRALFVMNKLDKDAHPVSDRTHVEKLGRLASGLSESTLRSLLDSPRLNVRFRALQALRQINFGEKTADEFIRELRHGEFTTAWVAAEILGEKGITKAIPELRRGLDSSDPFLKGKCMVALVRLRDTETYPLIREIFHQDTNPRIIIHGANALVEMEEQANIERILKKTLDPSVTGTVFDEVLTAVATICGCGERVYRFLREYNTDRDEALTLLDSSCEEIEKKIGQTLNVFSAIQDDYIPGTILSPILEYIKKHKDTNLQTVTDYLASYENDMVSIKMFYFITVVLSDHYRKIRIEYPFDQ